MVTLCGETGSYFDVFDKCHSVAQPFDNIKSLDFRKIGLIATCHTLANCMKIRLEY